MTPREELIALRRLAELEAKAGGAPAPEVLQQQAPMAVKAGRGIMEIPRQLGLAARHNIEGLGQLADIGTEPIRAGLQTIGIPANKRTSQLAASLSDVLGLPKPGNADERVVGDMTRMMAGGAGLVGGASKLAQGAQGVTQKVLGMFAANPGTQALSAAGAGGAGGSVREAGGGPMAEFGAALFGGLASPLAGQAVAAAGSKLANAARSMKGNTAQIDGVLRFELGKSGINWEDIGAATKLQLRKDAESAIYSGQPLDAKALQRLADFRLTGATPQLGDITQNPRTLTLQRNLSKQMANQRGGVMGADLPNIDNANASRVISTLENSATSPLDAYATGQRLIGGVRSKDASLNANVGALYGQARDSAGRSMPLDGAAFTRTANDSLRQNLSPKLGAEVDSILNDIAQGKTPLTVEYAEQIKTALGRKARAAQATEGDLAFAYGLVRKALDEAQPMPSQGLLGQESIEAFNAARSAAAGRFRWQESAKFIEDALGGAEPDKFVRKHVIGGSVRELQAIKDEMAGSPETLAAVKKQLVSYILERGKADGDTVKFSSASMKDALDSLERKLPIFFTAAEIQQIKSAVNVGRYSQSQPIGAAVNNSNSGAMMLGRLSDAMGTASSIPALGPLVAAPLQGGLLSLQARQMNNLGSGLLQQQAPRPGVVAPAALYGGLLGLSTLPPSQY